MMDDHGIWQESDASPEEARQIVRDMVQQARNQAKGNTPGHLKEAIEALNDPIVPWRAVLKQFQARHLGNRRHTFARRNRRRDAFGIKGVSRHAAARLSILIDTSGSISQDDLRQFFTEIEEITHRTKVNILMWDVAFCDFIPKYRRGDWRKIGVTGRGGTGSFDEAQDWLVKQGVMGDALIFLTDGCMNKEDFPKMKGVPIIVVLTKGGAEEQTKEMVEKHIQVLKMDK